MCEIAERLKDIEAKIDNLTSVQKNHFLYLGDDALYPVTTKGSDGRWSVCDQFPKTIDRFINLSGE